MKKGKQLPEPNKLDQFKAWCLNHRIVSVLIILGVIVVALGAFCDGVNKMMTLVAKLTPAQPSVQSPSSKNEISEKTVSPPTRPAAAVTEPEKININGQRAFDTNPPMFTNEIKVNEMERQKYLAYINTNIVRNSGEQLIAAVCISESGGMNSAIADALAEHFKREHLKVASSFFRPALISDGQFDGLFNGSKELFDKLGIEGRLDGLLLAREQVEYSNNTGELNGVITATMRVSIETLPCAAQVESQSWTLSAIGAGYDKAGARMNAEERIIRQIANDSSMKLTEFVNKN